MYLMKVPLGVDMIVTSNYCEDYAHLSKDISESAFDGTIVMLLLLLSDNEISVSCNTLDGDDTIVPTI
ncbi:hypothetical protein VNO78_02644 [Psophocarpus tetragonolobus]|uniref:Uncharacterized protein n=1 Tax=Psophocarpus tetragonolobus TaxID=3891 RepID=A0AAN9XVT7_PSOTE